MAENKEELQSFLMRAKESERAGLKLNFQKVRIMASGPITSQQKEREKVEAVTDLIFLHSKIIVDSDCSHKIKRQLPLLRKAKSVKKMRHHCADKNVYSLTYGFSRSHVWM